MVGVSGVEGARSRDLERGVVGVSGACTTEGNSVKKQLN